MAELQDPHGRWAIQESVDRPLAPRHPALYALSSMANTKVPLMALTEKHIYDALTTVKDPELHKDLVTLGMVKGVETDSDDDRAVDR